MKAAGKMLGLLALAGGTLLSVLFHIKDKSPPSASTAVWGGLTAWVAGAFQDRNSTVSQQLAFIPKSEWETLTETLGIHGAGGNKIIRRIRLAHSREETKRMLTQLKKRQMPEAHLVELRRKYIAKITGAEMTPDGRPTGKNAALATQFLALSHDQLVFLCESIVNATDASARGVLAYLTEHGVSSRTVAAEIRRCTTPSA
jgi:hypothetical protein